MAKRAFNSNNHIFRPTSLGAAMAAAGVIKHPHLIRDNKLSVSKAETEYEERMIPCRAAA